MAVCPEVAMEILKDRASFMRESLHKSQTITDNMVAILGSFDHRLSALETAMRPTQAEAKILKGPHEDLESYLEACDQLRSVVKFFSGNKNFKGGVSVITHATTLITKSIIKLDEEFRQLLTTYSKPVEPDRLFDCLPQSLRPSPGHNETSGMKQHQTRSLETAIYHPPALIPPRILPLLHALVHQLIQAGHQPEVFNIYREVRSSVVELSLRKLGVERVTKEDVQKMQWEVLEAKIQSWIHYIRIAVKLLFAAEKKVSDQIFEGHDTLGDQCFAEVTTNSVSVLFSFGEAISKSKRSPEKLFVLLDMYEIMREVQPEMDILFGNKYCGEVREAAIILTKRLAETAQETFVDFEEAVEKDATKTAVQDGTVHPLTSYVINYVKFLYDYQSTLKLLFGEFDDTDADAQMGAITTRIIQALMNNLDGKSKQYKDPALTQLFMMNNIHYIVRSVRRSEAKDMLGDDWVQIHRRIVQQHANQYKRLSWSKILQCLSIQGVSTGGSNSFTGDAPPSSTSSNVSRATVKDRYKTFNILFEELHQRQSQWTVPDSELRESLRLSVAEVLLTAYRSFNKRFGPMIQNGKNPQKYIRFTPEDLERMLSELFEGKTWNEQKR
ncbi:unnamed protein product [Cuscuta epithymum]|uniref:Exocyst subunit Exo70 family protein n=1 Tax=Cuscuta epithymum TaxID=186058 RepID=A0AAV0FI50_9ASTE|nr:unnamed protein product [Cuscuta epithymum]